MMLKNFHLKWVIHILIEKEEKQLKMLFTVIPHYETTLNFYKQHAVVWLFPSIINLPSNEEKRYLN